MTSGRGRFLSQFRDLASPEAQSALSDPADAGTFRRSKLDWSEREEHGGAVALHRDLLALRSGDPVFSGGVKSSLDGAVLGSEAFLVRWCTPGGAHDRLLLVNLGRDLDLAPAPEPLLAPPAGRYWTLRWSSEHAVYGGSGTPPVEGEAWHLPAGSALVMAPGPVGGPDPVLSALDAEGEDAPARE